MLTHPVALVLAVLGAAVLCFALGTFRGSWRVWLIGYALTVIALALSFAGVRAARRSAVPGEGHSATAVTAGAPSGRTAGRTGGSAPSAPSRPTGPAEPRR